MEELRIAPPGGLGKTGINLPNSLKHRPAELHPALDAFGFFNKPLGCALEIGRSGRRREDEIVEAETNLDVGGCVEAVKRRQEGDVRRREGGASDVGKALKEDDCSSRESD